MQAEQTARYADKRDRILAAAGDRLAREGLQGLDLAEIAAEVGLRRSSLTYYFGNVEDLAAAVLARRIEDMRAMVRAAGRQPSVEARLGVLFDSEIRTYYQWRAGEGPRPLQLGEIRAFKAERRKALGAAYRVLAAEVADLFLGEPLAGDNPLHSAMIASHLVLENLFWLPAWLGFFHPWEAQALSAEVVQRLLSGLADRDLPMERPPIPVAVPRDSAVASPDAYLRVATRLVCERGYRGASIERIASELNVTKGSFYHHIAMKDDLVEVCFERSFDRLAELQRSADEMGSGAFGSLVLALRSVVRAQFDGDFPFLRSSALPGLESELRARVIERAQRSIRWFSSKAAASMREGKALAGESFVAAQMLYIAANAAYDLAKALREERMAAEQTYIRMMFCGILQHSGGIANKAS